MSIIFLFAILWTPVHISSAEQKMPERSVLTHGMTEDSLAMRRGVLISVEDLGTMSKKDIASRLAEEGVPGIPRYDVTMYRVTYWTAGYDGKVIKASGAVAIPQHVGAPAPLLSYQHGTVSARHRVPSQEGFGLIGMVLGGSGYVTAFPDYIGLGTSDTFHPYVHAVSLGTAVVDLLRATRTLCATREVQLNDQLFLVGYSEGGFATMAAHREIEQHYADEFTVTASAPMAGPYNLSEVMIDQILDRSVYPSPGYLPYTLISYNRVYNLFGDLRGVMREPYASQMEGLFDGEKTLRFINMQLPEVPLDMLVDEFVASLREEGHPLREVLRQNDVHNWAPVAPMRLFHCVDDDQVSFRNAEMALKAFQQHGADHVELAALEFGDHESCAPPALFLGKLWLDGFKEDSRPSPFQANIKIIKASTF